MLSAFGQDFIDGHVLVFFICRVVMDMDAQHAGDRAVDHFLHTGGDADPPV